MMRRPLDWLLLVCGVGSAVSLGFALSAPRISVLAAVVRGWLVLASIILLGTAGGRSAGPFADRAKLAASQSAFLIMVVLGTYVLVRGRQPWPGLVLLGAAAMTNAVLLTRLIRHGRRAADSSR